jgi:tRNA A-37 threonylcarbamoyl transferase component Bud32
MDTNQLCPNCGKPVVSGAPQGLCPECLMKSGFDTKGGNEAGAGKPAFVPPSVEQMTSLFPQLEIIELLGQGGMGAVYKARQPRLNRFVALKILSPEKQNNPQFAERFEREARALAWLNQPNIVTVYDSGEMQGMFYLLMEFVDGLSLRQLLQQRRLASAEALAIVIQICQALQYAHEQGVIHRDIKPENILLDKKGQVKIADFGIAKLMEPEPQDISLTGAADVVGTPHYMAPEQIEKPQTVDQRADIYSLGVVFYEMLTGELPLGNFQPPSQKVLIDVRLDEVVLHALEKEPGRRYQEASAVKTAVETIASSTPPTTEAERLAHTYLAEDYTLDIGSCIRRGWTLVRSDFWRIMGVTILILFLRTAALATMVGLVVSGPLMGGLCLYFLKKIRGEPAGVGMAFSGFSKAFLPLFLASLLMGIFTFFGLICLLLPGVYLMVGWAFTLALVIDKQLGFWPAMGLSRKMIFKHWWKFFGFIIVLSLMNTAGMLVFFVGSLITVPVALAALMFAYEDIFNPKVPADLDLLVADPAQTTRQSNHILGWSFAGLLILLAIVGLAINHVRHVLLKKIDVVVTAVPVNPSPTPAATQPSPSLVPPPHLVASNSFENMLNADQRLVLRYINLKFERFADDRTFDGWSRNDRDSLEQRLLDVIKGPRSDEYYQAINTLAALHSTNALPLLQKMAFEHKDTINRIEINNRPRWMAIRAMGVIGDKAAVPEIIHLLYHNNSYVRWSAQIALVRLTGQNFGNDWRAWGKWWNDQRGNPPFNPEPVRWWRGQAEPDELAKELAEGDQNFLDNIQGKKSEENPPGMLIKTLSE